MIDCSFIIAVKLQSVNRSPANFLPSERERAVSRRGVSKLKLLCYNKEYEKTNDRGMEEMPEMWKDRKPGESRAQPLMRNVIAQMGTLDIWMSSFRGSISSIFTTKMTPSPWRVLMPICAIISLLWHAAAGVFRESWKIFKMS